MATVTAKYLGDLRVECTHVASGTKLVSDAPVDNNGKGEAFSPTDLCVTALASCAMTIIGIYGKMHNVGRLEYRFVERGGTKDAARQLGLCEHDIVKSLVFDDGKGGQAVMALMHGDERVSLHKLQRLSGVPHLQPSSPENAERLTGYKPGGICPFGLPSPLPVFAQISLFNLGMLYINAARPKAAGACAGIRARRRA